MFVKSPLANESVICHVIVEPSFTETDIVLFVANEAIVKFEV